MSLQIYYRLKLDYFINYLRSYSSTLKQSIIVLLLSSTTAVLAGLLLGYSRELLLLLPGMIILLPGALEMRGSIFAALGSRLSSNLHLGLVEKFEIKNKIIRNNIFASLALSLVLSVILGAFAYVVSPFLGMESISFNAFIFISVLAGLISGAFLLVMTFIVTFKSFNRGWDPDNIVAPIITTAGDFFTIPSLLLSAFIALSIEDLIPIISYIIITTAVLSLLLVSTKKWACRSIVLQSLPVLSFTVLISCVSGFIIESNIQTLVLIPSLLVLLPAFIGQCGNIGNIAASRISTLLHLGVVHPRLGFNKQTGVEFLNSFVLSVFVFPAISLITFLFSSIVGIQTIGLMDIIIPVTVTGFGVMLILSFVVFFISIISFKFNVDPDNVMIPIVTNVADIIGVLSLLTVLGIFGIL
jgi:mgtE-like transporter